MLAQEDKLVSRTDWEFRKWLVYLWSLVFASHDTESSGEITDCSEMMLGLTTGEKTKLKQTPTTTQF